MISPCTRSALATFALGVGLLAAAAPNLGAAMTEVKVTREAPVSTRQVFNPKRPSPKMPKLTPPESGVCDFDFTIDTGLAYSVGAPGAGTLEITVDEFDIKTGLAVRIWTAQGTPPKLLAHEEGHREICEYYYQNADFIAREVAEPLVGRTFVGRGANRKAAETDAVQQVLKRVSDGYMAKTRVRCSAAQKRYDQLTKHGLLPMTEKEAIARVLQEDPEPSRETRLAAAAASQPASTAAPATPTFWKWNELINRPDRWPPAAKLLRQVSYPDGTRFPKDTVLRVTKVTPREIEVILPDGSPAAFEPDETDFEQAANRYWATLTPEQRAVDLAAVVKEPNLQPTVVTTFVPLRFPKATVPAGAEVPLVDLVNHRLHVWGVVDRRPMVIEPMQTDLLVRARALVAQPATERVARIAALLEGTTVDLAGRPVAPASSGYTIIYGASSTCAHSQAYTPQFVERIKRLSELYPNIHVVSLSNDATKQAMLEFGRQHQLPGTFVPWDARHPGMMRYHVSSMPGITVLDPSGKEIGSQRQFAGARSIEAVLDRLEAELRKNAATL